MRSAWVRALHESPEDAESLCAAQEACQKALLRHTHELPFIVVSAKLSKARGMAFIVNTPLGFQPTHRATNLSQVEQEHERHRSCALQRGHGTPESFAIWYSVSLLGMQHRASLRWL